MDNNFLGVGSSDIRIAIVWVASGKGKFGPGYPQSKQGSGGKVLKGLEGGLSRNF